ncbi:MAG: GntR family transcriptional regulator [Lachnospiraceae bacterium]|nr:GntR family transcriptional regulator [Lachnospiraceae bacterium]MBP5600555.1 GntR family transcriptional regulator [Lachnospiraceae bacterium]
MALTDSKEIEKKRLEIVSFITHYITEQKLDVDKKIPSENKLAEMFNTNRNTVRSALVSLKIRGILYSRKGKGFFVANRPSQFTMNHDSSLGFSEVLESANLDYNSSLLSVEKRKPTKAETKHLDLLPSDNVFLLSQLRYVNDIPFALCYSTIPEKLAPDLDLLFLDKGADFRGTNHILMHKYGFKHPICSKTIISSFPPEEMDVNLLNLPDSIPILKQENIYTLDDKTPIEYFVIRARSDMFKINFNFNT